MMSRLITTIAILATGIAIGRKYHSEIDELLDEVKAHAGPVQPQEKPQEKDRETPTETTGQNQP